MTPVAIEERIAVVGMRGLDPARGEKIADRVRDLWRGQPCLARDRVWDRFELLLSLAPGSLRDTLSMDDLTAYGRLLQATALVSLDVRSEGVDVVVAPWLLTYDARRVAPSLIRGLPSVRAPSDSLAAVEVMRRLLTARGC